MILLIHESLLDIDGQLNSEQPPFDLVAVDGPLRVWDFFAAVEFEVGVGADFLDELADAVWLAAMDRSSFEEPASLCSVFKRERASNAEQQVFVRNSPVVTHSELWLDPDEAGLVTEAPGVDDIECFSKKCVGRPEMKVSDFCHQSLDGFVADFFE